MYIVAVCETSATTATGNANTGLCLSTPRIRAVTQTEGEKAEEGRSGGAVRTACSQSQPTLP